MEKQLSAIVASGIDGKPIAVDTETDGSPPHESPRLRLVSLSDGTDTIVLNPAEHSRTLQALLTKPYKWVAHNAQFDRAIIRKCLGIDMALEDTYTLAHLVDPRRGYEGGTGLSLAELADAYLGVPKLDDELKAEMKKGGWTWATIPIDNPVYLQYAARDAELTARLYPALLAFAPDPQLIQFEYQVAGACARMEARGVLLDRPYTEELVARLRREASEWADVAKGLGVNNVNSPRQVCAALGLASADKEHLAPLVAAGNELAQAVQKSRRATKWASAYGLAFLELAASDGRVHADIRPLLARTGRMSISRPPLQQLPASASMIRNCLLADEGQVMWSVDFDAVEVRVMAALSGDRNLRELLASGADIHDNTARTIFGQGFTDQERKLAKVALFCTAYGGGANAIVTQTGATLEVAQQVRSGFLRAYPGVGKLSRQLSDRSAQDGYVITRSGRRLPVDRNRGYAAMNYVIQSTARDLFAAALVDVEEGGVGGHLLLPIHDELLGQAPVGEAEDVADRVGVLMGRELDGIAITASGKVGARSWGSLYC